MSPNPLVPQQHLLGPPNPERRLRLMEIVRRALGERRYSERTEEAYVHWIRRFILANGRRHPSDLGPDEVRAFLSDLAVREGVSASTQNQAMAALSFLYARVVRRPLVPMDGIAPARRSRHLPVVLSQPEVRAIMARLEDPQRLCVALMYGSGLRVVECVSLRVKDVDLDRREIVVRGGKGGKDRRTPLAERCAGPLRRWLGEQARRHRVDECRGVAVTGLGEALERKYPGAAREWVWRYLFPASRTFQDPGGTRRRHHLHESALQRAIRSA